MEKKEYITELKKFVGEKNISIYDYYYLYVEAIKSNERFVLPNFELNNPFLNADDIKRLLECREDRIAEYYAYAISKLIEYNDVLTKSDIIDVIDGLFDKELSRENIYEVIDQELEKKITRDDIHTIINKELEPKTNIAITSINRDMANHLDGFVVIREAQTGKAYLYHHDSNKNILSGKQVYSNNKLTADTGFYVNYSEYINRLIDIIISVYPTMEDVDFIKDGEVKGFGEVLEEVFKELRDSKTIRFGKDLKNKDIDTYKDLANIPIKKEDYQGKELQTGIYVRRDLLTDLFDDYKVRITYSDEKEKSVLK